MKLIYGEANFHTIRTDGAGDRARAKIWGACKQPAPDNWFHLWEWVDVP